MHNLRRSRWLLLIEKPSTIADFSHSNSKISYWNQAKKDKGAIFFINLIIFIIKQVDMFPMLGSHKINEWLVLVCEVLFFSIIPFIYIWTHPMCLATKKEKRNEKRTHLMCIKISFTLFRVRFQMICSLKPLLKLDLIFFECKKSEKLAFNGFLVDFINGF